MLTGWVWFRALDVHSAMAVFAGLFGLNGFGIPVAGMMQALQPLTIAMMVLGWPLAIFGLPVMKQGKLAARMRYALYGFGDSVVVLLLFLLCVMTVGAAAYSPFLYFRF